jgi:transposase-like protein
VCKCCGASYSIRSRRHLRYSRAFEEDIVRRHVEGRESYRVIARGVYERTGRKISASSLQRMVEEVGKRCKTAWEMSLELKPRWNGVLLVDEKMCSIRGAWQWWYVAVDGTGDIVHCQAVKELNVTEATGFLREVKELSSRLGSRGIVTDLDTALTKAVEAVYAGKPHQYCLKHALWSLERSLGYNPLAARWKWTRQELRERFTRLPDRKGFHAQQAHRQFVHDWDKSRGLSERYRQLHELRELCRRILFAASEQNALERFKALRRSQAYDPRKQRIAIRFFQRHWSRLMAYHRVVGLPRTTNIVENVNKQFERRFKTIEAFQHRWTAISYVNLLVAYLRQKPYTDCRGTRKYLNGKSRLQAASVHHPNDWLRLALKTS